MIGLSFLGAAILWLVVVYQVTRRVPVWLKLKKQGWLVQAFVALALLVGPFADHIVGMWQFQKLCDERTAINIGPNASSVRRATDITSDEVPISGYVINIKMSTRTYFDLDTNKPFLSY